MIKTKIANTTAVIGINIANAARPNAGNNAIKICSPAVAANFTTEFEEMFISREPGATPAQRARFEAVFGTPATR